MTRPSLTLVRAQPPTPTLRVPSLRLVLAALVLGLIAAGAYALARETSVFAVERIEVTGAPPNVAEHVLREVEAFRGESLVSLDQAELGQRLRALPWVASASYDREFPNTLEIQIRPEKPIAVIRSAQDAWLVSKTGRIIRPVEIGARPQLPRIWVPSPNDLAPGARVTRDQKLPAIRALANLPDTFPFQILAAREQGGEITLILAGHREIRLGEATLIPLKLEIATRVLRAQKRAGDPSFRYVDVSLPDRVVVG